MSSHTSEPGRRRKTENKHRVVIVGCGFGGLFAVKALRRAPVEVVLVDRTNHHLFQPLLYQVATGSSTRATSRRRSATSCATSATHASSSASTSTSTSTNGG